MLYQLSYASLMERETGIGPATNSLEGCDSTTELLPRRITLYQEAGRWAKRAGVRRKFGAVPLDRPGG